MEGKTKKVLAHHEPSRASMRPDEVKVGRVLIDANLTLRLIPAGFEGTELTTNAVVVSRGGSKTITRAGVGGTSVIVNSGRAVSGDWGVSRVGRKAAAISGDYGVSVAGNSSAAISDNYGVSVAQDGGIAAVGDFGVAIQMNIKGHVRGGHLATLVFAREGLSWQVGKGNDAEGVVLKANATYEYFDEGLYPLEGDRD